MARAQGGEPAAAVGADGDFQPAIRAGELIAEVERGSEVAIAHGGGGVGQRAADLARTAADAEQGEGEVVGAGGGQAVVGELAFVGERRALGENS